MNKILIGCTAFMMAVATPGIVLKAQVPEGASAIAGKSKSTLTLEEFLERCVQNDPLNKQKALIYQMGEKTRRSLALAYLPQLKFEGKASYQTEVPRIPIDLSEFSKLPIPMEMPEIPEIPKFQYSTVLQLQQAVWDGGQVHAGQKRVEAETALQAEQAGAKVKQVEQNVQDLYFGILMLDAQGRLQQSMIDELGRQMEKVQSAMEHGVATLNDYDQIKVEEVQARQQMEQVRVSRAALVQALKLYIGESGDGDLQLSEPNEVTRPMIADFSRRPEQRIFDAQKRVGEAQWSEYISKNMPVLGLFAQGGYAKPGLDMFSPEFKPYLIYGVQLTWNFGNLYRLGTEKFNRRGRNEAAELQRASFERDMGVAFNQAQGEVDKYKAMLDSDQEVIRLRKEFRERANIQLDEGVITRTDYVERLTELTVAEQTYEVHRLQYLKALHNLHQLVEE